VFGLRSSSGESPLISEIENKMLKTIYRTLSCAADPIRIWKVWSHLSRHREVRFIDLMDAIFCTDSRCDWNVPAQAFLVSTMEGKEDNLHIFPFLVFNSFILPWGWWSCLMLSCFFSPSFFRYWERCLRAKIGVLFFLSSSLIVFAY